MSVAMLCADLHIYCCPTCRQKLTISEGLRQGEDRVASGQLTCQACQATYAISHGIPRFVPQENYSQSFGFQWKRHCRTQLDKFNGTTLSAERFWEGTQWSPNLDGQTLLEAGSGAGRFTQIALDAGATVWSFDYSNAVEANAANNGIHDRLHLFQGDLYAIPLPIASFDKVFCFGVLQHCPDVKRAFLSLLPYLKLGGDIAVDIYDWDRRNPSKWQSLYWVRQKTATMNPRILYRWVQWFYPGLLLLHRAVSSRVGSAIRRRLPLVREIRGRLVPIQDYRIVYQERMSAAMIREWSILDTFDLLSPRYDQPQKLNDVESWFHEADLTNVCVRHGGNGVIGTGTKP